MAGATSCRAVGLQFGLQNPFELDSEGEAMSGSISAFGPAVIEDSHMPSPNRQNYPKDVSGWFLDEAPPAQADMKSNHVVSPPRNIGGS